MHEKNNAPKSLIATAEGVPPTLQSYLKVIRDKIRAADIQNVGVFESVSLTFCYGHTKRFVDQFSVTTEALQPNSMWQQFTLASREVFDSLLMILPKSKKLSSKRKYRNSWSRCEEYLFYIKRD